MNALTSMQYDELKKWAWELSINGSINNDQYYLLIKRDKQTIEELYNKFETQRDKWMAHSAYASGYKRVCDIVDRYESYMNILLELL